MRALEIVLIAADLLALVAVAVALRGGMSWLSVAAPIALLVAGAQLFIEGPRWQIVPAYALTILFFLLWLSSGIPSAASLVGRRWVLRLITGVGTLGLLGSTVVAVLFPVFRLPSPSGPHAIGTSTYHWIDDGRPELFTMRPGEHRELMVQLWYPAKYDRSLPRARYVKDAAALAPLARLLRLPSFTFGHLAYITTNAREYAPVADGEAKYPILIFSHGNGGFRQHNTWQVEEVVSHGYIVAAIDHPYAAAGVVFPDGHVAAYDVRMRDRSFEDGILPYLAQDVVFALGKLLALDQADPNGILTGRLDLERVGVFGLSLGGEIAAEACHLEARLRACLAMDVWMPPNVVQAGLQQPTMWISRDAATMRLEGWAEGDIDRTLNTVRVVFERVPEYGYFILVPGMFHVDFSDAPLLSPLTSWLGLSGPIDARRAHGIVSSYSLAFFDRHLKGKPAALLDGPSERYPEVHFEARRP